MTGYDSKRQMAADKLWDKPSVAFDEWWNSDNDESTNPFRLESGAYWAWAGWKAALAQPAQEPLAWMCSAFDGEPCEQTNHDECGNPIPLYTTPPQREWVGLTDDEHETLWIAIRATGYLTKGQVDEVMEVVEAKLKEKNNGA